MDITVRASLRPHDDPDASLAGYRDRPDDDSAASLAGYRDRPDVVPGCSRVFR